MLEHYSVIKLPRLEKQQTFYPVKYYLLTFPSSSISLLPFFNLTISILAFTFYNLFNFLSLYILFISKSVKQPLKKSFNSPLPVIWSLH